MNRAARRALFAAPFALASTLGLPLRAADGLLGFGPDRVEAQRALEARFDAALDADQMREWMRRLSARPHPVGSPFGKEVAEFVAAQFRSWGYETRIETFHVLFPTPVTRELAMVAPTRFQASLAEPALAADATSGQTREQLPVYNAYSVDGDVTGDLVYVNYGVPRDYEELERRGIDVAGKVVIARYGGSWRGIKPKVAAERGAIGCLIYSDPRDDGYFRGDAYPDGAWRSDRGAQRGSVADMPLHPGDPLTPGVGATSEARRLPLGEARTLTRIPVLPLSWADALPLLRALGGPVVPEAWRGALPFTYHFGPGPARVHLKVAFDWKQAPAYDVIAVLRGSERPDQWIIRGNHHDAWVNGANDPVSGLVALMAEARAVAKLRQEGFLPRRTIVYAAWDAEEPGLLGSTEWVEAHAAELRDRAAVYINTDSNGRGFLSAGGSHSLEKLVNEAARAVADPAKGISVLERERSRLIVQGTPEERKEARERADLRLEALGSGSDYTPFLQHLGVASLNLSFGGEDGWGTYHSIYDSFDYYTRFGDPDFAYGVALARTTGRIVLRLAGADVLPFEFTALAETVGRYVREVVKIADDLREETEEDNRRVRERTLEAVADPRQPFVAPKPRAPVPFVNFAPLHNAAARLERSAQALEEARRARRASGAPLGPEREAEIDRVLMGSERALTRPEGLPRRPWYRHQVYAPGFYTGYGVKTLPGVREALEERQWNEAAAQVGETARALERLGGELERAAALYATRP
ncbi:MAG TPA: M28 family metallopeptidase [Vicinamibacteria bacterium]|nr:M28 family metallopeptidase [Vicinamibacteria bacterium]